MRSSAVAIVGALLALSLLCDVRAEKAAISANAERLVEDANQAELSGNTAERFRLLRDAVRIAPDFELARWQLGQMQVDGEWVSVEEAQRRAAVDSKQLQYRDLRKSHGETPEGQLALARWCRKNGLNEEAQFHWASVLSVDPSNDEALRAVDMRWSEGQLLTREQIARQRARKQDLKRVTKQWEPKITKWQRDSLGSDAAKREAALAEIRAIKTAEVVPLLEQITLVEPVNVEKRLKEFTALSLAVLDALNSIREQPATTSLVRHAIYSPISAARASTIEKLKARPQHEYVPLLLSGLAMPLESSFTVQTSADGSVHYRHSLFREGADSDWERDVRLSAMQQDLGGRHYTYDVASKKVEVYARNGNKGTELAKKARVTSNYLNRYGKAAAATELQVQQVNQATEALNAVIIQVLTGATGEKFETPRAWWDWWQDHNEYYASDERPVDRQYYSDTDTYQYGGPTYAVRYPPPPPPPPPPPGGYRRSCFAKGTPVWTKTGQRPIETLELGEMVLSQSVETGELSYKPVVGRTVRPPSEILKLTLDGGELRTTVGHPLWVAGVGWRMAKELEDGAILHGVTGSPRVLGVEKSGQEEAYNLIVADFNTYFVGDSGVLVHDNTPRTPTRKVVPGLAAK